MRTENLEIPGPAAGRDVGTVNRLGSARVPLRRYEPAAPPRATLVWAHGGSFVRGTLDWPEADWVARGFAEAGLRVVSVDYVLAGAAVRAPAPENDVAAALQWASASAPGPVVVGGASAGAHLAVLAALAQAERAARQEARPVDAMILLYPTLHRVQRPDAVLASRTARIPESRRFGAARIAAMYDDYLGPDLRGGPARVAGELTTESLASLPPTVIVNADVDDLRASGEQFAEQLAGAGVRVAQQVQPGTQHGYLNRPEESPGARDDARATIDRVVAELRDLGVV